MTKKLTTEQVYRELMRERAVNDKLRKRVKRFAAVINLATEKLSEHLLGTKSVKDIKKELFDKVNKKK